MYYTKYIQLLSVKHYDILSKNDNRSLTIHKVSGKHRFGSVFHFLLLRLDLDITQMNASSSAL